MEIADDSVLARFKDGKTIMFFCEACDTVHGFNTTWKIEGPDSAPTVSPSLLVTGRSDYRCHAFIKNGHIEYLSDCSHAHAGKTLKLIPWNKSRFADKD